MAVTVKYSIHDRLREKTHIYAHYDLVTFLFDVSHLLIETASEVIAKLEYGSVNVYTSDYEAGGRFFITRHTLEV